MTSLTLLEMQLRSLNLQEILSKYGRLLKKDSTPLGYLQSLISIESTKRDETTIQSRIMAARFPVLKTSESFDFPLQPGIPRVKLLEHFEGKFIEEHRHIILCGPPGAWEDSSSFGTGLINVHEEISCLIHYSGWIVDEVDRC